ncbi:hypothetical protein SEA_SUCHA_59 [Microbacterium phage Sucha]|nr:hypothetical protein SEA_SUCHA_59 [Microbacterium phage Sucha]
MGAPDAEKLTTTPRSAVLEATKKGGYPRSGSAVGSRVSVRHVKGFRLGLSRSVAPIFPAGSAIAWTVSLGKLELVWGRVR